MDVIFLYRINLVVFVMTRAVFDVRYELNFYILLRFG